MSILTLPALTVNPSFNRHGLRAPKGGCRVDGRFYKGGCFCRPYDEANPLELPVVQVADASYLLEVIDPTDSVSAIRLTKLVSGDAYRVERHEDGHVSCQCKGYEFRGTCRHASYAMVAGLLPVAPVVEAPAHERPATAFIAGLIQHHQEETIRSVACPLVERHRAIHESGPASPESLGWSSRAAWSRMDTEDREGFAEWLEAIGYRPARFDDCPSDPADRWDFFIAECRDGAPIGSPVGDDYRPDPGPGFTPTPESEAEWAGFTLARGGEDADAPLGMPRGIMERFYRGTLEADRDRIMAGWGQDQDQAWADPLDRIHDAERCGVC